jgi:integrase
MKIIKRTNKDGSTSWTTVLAMPRDPVTGERQQKRITAHTKREVEQEVARIRNETRTGTYLEPTKLTLAEYLERWMAAIEPKVRPQTFRSYRRICRQRIGAALGNIPLASLSPLHIQDWYTDRLATGLTTTTVRLYHGVLHTALKQAVRLRLLPSNPADAVEQPKRRHVEMKTWDAAQVRKFLEATADHPLGTMWRLAVLTGLRQGEILGLTWDDIDLERGTLSVRRGVILGKAGREFGPTKSRAGQRQVALPASCVTSLRAHRARQNKERLALGPAWRDLGLVFPRYDGDVYPPSTLRKRWVETIKLADVPYIRFHDMRHTSATLALILGEHPKVVQERLGHSSIKMTLDRYSHVTPNMQREAADRLDRAIGE